MAIRRRIYFSMPAEETLSPGQAELQWAVAKKVQDEGFIVEVFARPVLTPGLAAGTAWTVEGVDRVAARCMGAVLIGTPRWVFQTDEGEFRFPTEYCHYEGAITHALGLPRLVLAEEDLVKRVVFDYKAGEYIATFPRHADSSWLDTSEFQHPFDSWKLRLQERRDIFLGYSSSSSGLANGIKNFLKALGVTVVDWKEDFAPASTILEQIQDAAARCSGGIFLFTKDDKLVGEESVAAPRDNVVFEAGFFANAKGKERVLIVRESGSKLPADLGGNIYAVVEDRSDIGPIEGQIKQFLKLQF